MEVTRKPLLFVGSSHDDLKAFPDEARRDAGFNLDFVQRGLEPQSWKPINRKTRKVDVELAARRFAQIGE